MTLTERQRAILRRLSDSEWQRASDVGGTDKSHHSRTLAQLARKELAIRQKMCGCVSWLSMTCKCKCGCFYKRSVIGKLAVNLK